MPTVTATHLTTDTDPTDGNIFTTASISPSANKEVIVFLAFGQATVGTAAITGAGMTWVEIANRPASVNQRKAYAFRALSNSPGSGPLTITISGGGGTPNFCCWSIVEFGNVAVTGVSGADGVVQSAVDSSDAVSSLTVNLGAFTSLLNATYGGFFHNATDTITPGSGFSLLGQAYNPSDGQGIMTEWRSDPDTSVDAAASSSASMIGIAIELKFVSPAQGAFLYNFV